MTTTALGISKVFILDKYFNELQKFWDTEKRLQDATSASEAANLQSRLRTLSSGLVGLRNCIHENDGGAAGCGAMAVSGGYMDLGGAPGAMPVLHHHQHLQLQQQQQSLHHPQQQTHLLHHSHHMLLHHQPAPAALSNGTALTSINQMSATTSMTSTFPTALHQGLPMEGMVQVPHLSNQGNDGFNTLRSNRSHVTEVSSVMTANVSDPSSSSAGNNLHHHHNNGNNSVNNNAVEMASSSCQMASPAQPVASMQLQPNYSNIQQPAPVMASSSGSAGKGHSLPSNNSPAVGSASPFSGPPVVPVHCQEVSGVVVGGAVVVGAANGGAFSRSAVRPRTPTTTITIVRSNPSQSLRTTMVAASTASTSGSTPPGPPDSPVAAAGPGDRLRRRERVTAAAATDEVRKSSKLADLKDLIHLEGDLTEDLVVRALQARFFSQNYYTRVGPILLSVNPYREVGNPLTLTSTREAASSAGCAELGQVVQEAVRMQRESGYPQAVIVSGSSGSGKTFTSMALLRKLFEVAGGCGAPSSSMAASGSGGLPVFPGASALTTGSSATTAGTRCQLETDTFKHLAAAFTVLRSLCASKTAANRESSRVGHFIEVQVSDGALYRTKIHCYFLDHSRVVRPPPTEKNYHIFYQMLAGLSLEERSQLGLEGFTVRDLLYLNMGDTRQDEVADAQRFAEWKANLAVLGIPFMDVLRVFAAILLLGNVEFVAPTTTTTSSSSAARAGQRQQHRDRGEAPDDDDEDDGHEAYDVEVLGQDELNSVASLLGVSSASLLQGLTSRTHMARGQPVRSMSDANLCNASRNALAKALYCRTVATIVRRANSLKRPVGPLSGGTMSSDSNESVRHEVASHHASTVGTAGSRRSSRSMAILNNAVRHATDGFIGILDMFGFEDSKPSQLEQLCINLCSETMQHFYNTHIFKSSIESCKDEGIASSPDVVIEYVDNVPCIDLISSLRTGLLSMLDVECSVRGLPDTYVQKVKVQHKDNRKLFEPKHCDLSRTFGIHHFAGPVVYDTSDFLDTNRDVVPDDLVCIFSRDACRFGFATHLFSNEIKALQTTAANAQLHSTAAAAAATTTTRPGATSGGKPLLLAAARGASFRISPTSTSHPDHQLLNGDEPVSTLTQDFHTRLDNLLRTLVHAKPHFVRCVRPNEHDSLTEFDRAHVAHQVRSLQVLETVNLMAKGFPHRMRYKAFNSRYRSLTFLSPPSAVKALARTDEKVVQDCELILDCYSHDLRRTGIDGGGGNNNREWAHGRKHVFLSEGARQQLEATRSLKRHLAASKVQSAWRGWSVRNRQRLVLLQLQGFGNSSTTAAAGSGSRSAAAAAAPRLAPSHPVPAGGGAPAAAAHQPTTMTSAHLMGSGYLASGGGGSGGQQDPLNLSLKLQQQPSSTVASFQQVLAPPNYLQNGGLVVVNNSSSSSSSLAKADPQAHQPIIRHTTVPAAAAQQQRPRPQPISGTPPPDSPDRCDFKTIQQTCSLFGLDPERPPPVPPSRPYTVDGNKKITFPQTRTMKKSYPESGSSSQVFLIKGEAVSVIGASHRRGHLVVEKKKHTVHVPFSYLELKPLLTSSSSRRDATNA